MPNIGTLAAKLTLDPTQWTGGVDAAARKLDTFQSGVGRAAGMAGQQLAGVSLSVARMGRELDAASKSRVIEVKPVLMGGWGTMETMQRAPLRPKIETGGAFGKLGELKSMLAGLNMRPTVETAAAITKIGELKNTLTNLAAAGNNPVRARVETAAALAKVAELRSTLGQLAANNPLRPKVETAAAQAKIAELKNMVVAGTSAIRPKVETGGALAKIGELKNGIAAALNRVTDIPVVRQLKAGLGTLNAAYDAFLTNRYGKVGQLIKYSGMAADAAMTGITTALGSPRVIPGMSIIGSLPALALAEIHRQRGPIVAAAQMLGTGAGRALGAGMSMARSAAAPAAQGLAILSEAAGNAARGVVNFVAQISAGVPPLQAFFGALGPVLRGLPLIGGLLGGIADAGAGFMAWIEGASGRLLRVRNMALTFGVDSRRMGAMLAFAGGDAEIFSIGLARLTRSLGEVAIGNEEAIGKINGLGLSARALAAMPLDQAFLRIAARIRELPTAAERGKVAFDLFGRSGMNMLPMLDRAGESFDQFEARFNRMGRGASAPQLDQLLQSRIAMARISQAVDGLRTQFAVQLAPYITAIGEALRSAGLDGVNMAEVVTNALEGVISVVAFFADGIDAVKAAWKTLQLGVEIVLDGVITAVVWTVEKILDLWGNLPDFLGGGWAQRTAANLAAFRQELARELGRTGQDVVNSVNGVGAAGRRVEQVFAQIRNGAARNRNRPGAGRGLLDTEARAEMDKMLAGLPLEKWEAEMTKLRNMTRLGLPRDVFNQFAGKARDDLLQAFNVDIRSPAEKYQQSIRGLEQAWRRGALTAGEFAEAMRRSSLNLMENAGIQNADTGLAKLQDRMQKLQGVARAGIRFNFGDEWKKAQSELLGFDVTSPLERFQSRIADLDKWLAAGAINADQYALAVDRAVGELDKAGAGENKAVGAMLAGTQQALSVIAANERTGTETAADRLRRVQEQTRDETRRVAARATEMVAALRAAPRPLIARF